MPKIAKNYWIPIASICLVVGGILLFEANANIDSKVAIMTLLKQTTIITSVILGKIMFKEEDIIKKLFYSLLIIIGIAIMLVF